MARSSPKMVANWAASSTGTGTCTGPEAANPANSATSILGRRFGAGRGCASKRIPGSGRAAFTKRLLHFQALVGDHELFQRHVGSLGVQRTAGVLDDAGAHQ